MADLAGGGAPTEVHRLYHLPASNTAVGQLILEEGPERHAAGVCGEWPPLGPGRLNTAADKTTRLHRSRRLPLRPSPALMYC